MQITLTRFALSCAALAAVGYLAGCGGDGGGGDTSSPTPIPAPSPTPPPSAPTTTLSGVAATGAALLNAEVTLNYPAGSKKCTTNSDTGGFNCDTTGLTGPFVLSATGVSNEANITLTSAGTANSGVLNVTPITHAIVATALGGTDPNSTSASELTALTANKLNEAHDAYKALLKPIMDATGNSGASLLSGDLVVGNSAQDKLLDNLKVDVQPGGAIVLETLAGRSDDTPKALEIPAGAAATTVAAQPVSQLPTSATLNGQPVDLSGTKAFSAADLKRAQTILNACFDSTAEQRQADTFDQCNDIVVDDVSDAARLPGVPANYLSNGRNDQEELSPFATSSDMDGARFALPEIVRILGTNNDGQVNKVWVRLNWVRKDGLPGQIDSVAQIAVTPTSTDTGWRLVGNQRNINAFVVYRAGRRTYLNPATSPFGNSSSNPGIDSSGYTNEIQTYVATSGRNGFEAQYAVISSGDSNKTNAEVGLPAGGLFLRRSTGVCDFLTVTGQMAATDITGNDITNAVNKFGPSANCASNFRVAAVAVDPAKTINWPTNNRNWLATPLQSTDKLAAFTKYRIRIYGADKTTPARNYVVSVPTLMPSVISLRNYVWHDLEASTLASMNPTSPSAFTGGNSFVVNWKNKANARPVGGVGVQILPSSSATTVFLVKSVPFAAPGILQTANIATPGGVTFPSVASLGSGGFSFTILNWVNPNGLSLSSAYQYSQP
jgi:hypothetical protein